MKKLTWRMNDNVGPHYRRAAPRLDAGDVFEAAEAEVAGFRDKLTLLSSPPPPPETAKAAGAGLQLRKRGHGWYDVVNPATGEPVNAKALSKKDALSLIDGSGDVT